MHPIIPIDSAHLVFKNQQMLNFTSTDYLNLAHHPEIKKQAMKYLLQYGLSESSTSYPQGVFDCQIHLEEKLATLLGVEAALLLPNAVFGRYLIHKTFPELKITPAISPFTGVIVESAPFIDDSDAFGVLGYQGMGLGAGKKEVQLILGTFSKACGVSGAYMGTSSVIKEQIAASCEADFCLSPTLLGAIDASLDLIIHMDGERSKLYQRALFFRQQLKELGFHSESNSHLIPIQLSSEEEAHELISSLEEAQILARRIAPRTILFSINLLHSPDDLNQLADRLITAQMALV